VDTFSFLKGLPAILGVVAFFAYLWSGQYRIGGDLMKGIVEKLRATPNVDIQRYGALTPARIERLIQQDTTVRSAVNDQDIKLIRLIVILHNVITIVVLLVCAILIGLGIWLISRPEPLSVIPHSPTAVIEGHADDPLVDLDPLKADWDATGAVDNVSVFLENAESNARTTKKNVLADVHSVEFTADEIQEVASTRDYRGKNRIRTVVEWPGHTVRSGVVELLVGLKVRLMIDGKLVTPDGTRSINTLVATIDDSTEHMPTNYCFTVDFAGWNRSGPLVAPLKACNASSEVELPFLDEIDWTHHAGLVFNEPVADRLLARLCIVGPEYRDRDC
jgi:hypothetical protein